MHIFEYATCNVCGNTYRGEFVVELTGVIRCVDCKNPTKINEDVQWEDTTSDDPQIVYERMRNMLIRDIEILYPQYEIGGESSVTRFYVDGEIDARKLYFMGNDLALASEVHKCAYACLAYLDTGLKKYSDFAEKIVGRYMEMRERKLTDEEVAELIDWINSDVMYIVSSGDFL